MGASPFLPLPSTLSIDAVEQQDRTLLVHLHATSPIAPCPRCGTAGSRVHSRYHRTIADVACVGQRLVLKVLVRKWVCPEPCCPQRIFAEQFPGLAKMYARMTDRLREALQGVGVTTNGSDGARLFSQLAMPTTSKTIIRRVLQLPLPQDVPVRVAGVDEWAWKKGAQYGTILVDLEQRRVAALLPDRSVETTAAWFTAHTEVEYVSRDRGKIFREAATCGAPQALQVADRFHLQKNWAEALEKVFRHKTRLLKTVARRCAGKLLPPASAPAAQTDEQRRNLRHRQRVALHKRVWKLCRAGHHKEAIAQIVGISSRSVYRILEQEAAPPPQRRSRTHTHHLADPYLSYLAERWNQGCHTAYQLYEEIRAQGYPGSLRTIERVTQGFRPHGSHLVSKQAITFGKPPSAHSTALMIVRPAQNRTKDQIAFLDQLVQSAPTMARIISLAQDFGNLLRQREGKARLEQWKAAVRESGIAELIEFVDGLADDAEAVANGCTLSWSNGMVEGFVNKVKWIKRSSYGQAGFPLLQRRVLLHPAHGGDVPKRKDGTLPADVPAPVGCRQRSA